MVQLYLFLTSKQTTLLFSSVSHGRMSAPAVSEVVVARPLRRQTLGRGVAVRGSLGPKSFQKRLLSNEHLLSSLFLTSLCATGGGIVGSLDPLVLGVDRRVVHCTKDTLALAGNVCRVALRR
jgi:hypothetical protein